ncbi:cmgc clk protein kinase [Lichtheimia corymbifera JMRC:FSU:9682]|uniref:Cmgc clk protein kinase n=1 Tax=Lichtheimia corymbifera JMRC:FSU:9682 TaxID=1263082 RepID=A0A068S9W1_9FUNG|nr:cmgc clk protein kinase [Lichtheimia corymbifera JMRC:FSU:9682]
MTSAILSTKRNRGSNWEAEFYKNGYPKEIIVIEDTPPPDQAPATTTTTNKSHANASYTVVPAPAPPTPSAFNNTTMAPRSSSKRQRPPHNNNESMSTSTIPNNNHFMATNKRRRRHYPQPVPTLNALNNPVTGVPAPPISPYYPTSTVANTTTTTTATATTAADAAAAAVVPNSTTTTTTNITSSNTTFERPRSLADKDGHFIVRQGDFLTDRYQIHETLGQGTYGKVVKCYDHVRRCSVAIKIIRAIPKYKEASQTEIRVLDTLKDRDSLNFNQCIHLLDWFEYCNHVCMVFELLDQSVFDFLKANHFEPFPISHIQHFAKQLLTSVAFTHELKVIHTDLKPENILLKNHKYSEVPTNRTKNGKVRVLHDTEIILIDFGSATFEDDYHSSVVSTRHYRAPEIILGLGWSYPCDVWSIGCILVEFFTGEALFQTHDNLEHLAMMEMVLGKIPARLVQNASPDASKYFRNGRLNYPASDTTPQSQKYVKSLKSLKSTILPRTRTNLAFLDLVQKMLTYDPNKRITAREALRHRFFHIDFDEFGREIV